MTNISCHFQGFASLLLMARRRMEALLLCLWMGTRARCALRAGLIWTPKSSVDKLDTSLEFHIRKRVFENILCTNTLQDLSNYDISKKIWTIFASQASDWLTLIFTVSESDTWLAKMDLDIY